MTEKPRIWMDELMRDGSVVTVIELEPVLDLLESWFDITDRARSPLHDDTEALLREHRKLQ